MAGLNVNNTEMPIAKITTEDQARNWVLELVADMVKWREQCNVVIPDNQELSVQCQKRALWTFLNKQGQVIGALKTLRMCSLISDKCFVELNQQALNTLIPTNVGIVQ